MSATVISHPAVRTARIPAYCDITTAAPVFKVRVRRHVGLLLAWYSREYTFTGSYAECQQELARADRLNRMLGWWSIPSVLLWNWVALTGISVSRKSLQREAAVRFGHPSTYTGPAALRLVPTDD